MKKMAVNVRFGEPKDLGSCIDFDYEHVSESMIKRKIEETAVILAEVDGKPIGYLRVEYLWLIVPFVSLITIEEGYRRKGVGSAMIKFLEDHLIKNGHKVLHSSSQVDEPEPQIWQRKIGFEECGIIAGMNDGVGEIFFRKTLGK